MKHTCFKIVTTEDHLHYEVRSLFSGAVYCSTCGSLRGCEFDMGQITHAYTGRELNQPHFYAAKHDDLIWPFCSVKCMDVFEITPWQ